MFPSSFETDQHVLLNSLESMILHCYSTSRPDSIRPHWTQCQHLQWVWLYQINWRLKAQIVSFS